MEQDTPKHEPIFALAWSELSGDGKPRPDWFEAACIREFSLISWLNSAPGIVDEFSFLGGEHFYIQKLGRVWDAAKQALSENGAVTLPTCAKIAKVDVKDLLIWTQYGNAVATTRINARDYAEEIVRVFHAARVSEAARASLAAGSSSDISAITTAAEQARAEMARIGDWQSGVKTAGSVAEAMLALTDERMASGGFGGATTGIADLDQMIGGLKPSQLYIIAGRPGMGKSTIAGSIARQCAKAGNGVFFGSLELAEDMQMARFLADEAMDMGASGIAYEDILRATIRRDQRERLGEAAQRIAGYPLLISDKTNITVAEIRSMAKEAAAQFARSGRELKLVVLDYLKFIRATDRYAGQRVNEVGEITGALKAMAKEMGIAVILVCQLNRQNEQREDKRPQLSDLRESGDIEQDADVVMFVYRDEYYARRETDEAKRDERLTQCRNIMEILVEKNRNGRTDTVRAWCDVATQSVRDLAWQR